MDSAGLEGSAVFSLRRVDGDDDLHRAGLFFDAAVGLHADPVQLANRVEHGVDEDSIVAQYVADVRPGRLGREQTADARLELLDGQAVNIIRTRSSQWEMGSDYLFSSRVLRKRMSAMASSSGRSPSREA